MGYPMAGFLARAGHEVTVFNRTKARAEAWASEHGGATADTPAVAATQFTAYMALLNLVIAYSAAWQGWWIERFGYPNTLLVDGCFGLVCILLLPLMTKREPG